MFSDVKYLDYNENKYMIDDYFYIMLEWRKSKALEALKNYCNKRGNAVNEEMRCFDKHIRDYRVIYIESFSSADTMYKNIRKLNF